MQSSYFSELETKYNKLFMEQQRISILQQEVISAKDEVIMTLHEISAIKNQPNVMQETKSSIVGGVIGGGAVGGTKGSGAGSVCKCTLTSTLAQIHQSESEAEAVQATLLFLEGIFGKQDAFYTSTQSTLILKVAELTKRLYGDKFIPSDFIKILSNQELLKSKVQELKALEGESSLISFFEDGELLQTYVYPMTLGIIASTSLS
ncbi:hypothetical protein ABC382_00365 [Lysinibacillus sp. 1P01SD]|uniref:hypothetical protein n=1 Tax=Lysinibacillus sp. 1P01SD TaxID=3132285 RepID=UPI0039A2AABA